LRVALRLSCRLVAKFIRDLFHEDISLTTIEAFLQKTADPHEVTEELLWKRLLQSPAIHVDETKISILGNYQQVWAITNGSEVFFRLTDTRETGFLQDLLDGYPGVLVSDFYGGYDAIACRQQKCLVHLIRDLNEDLWKNPFNIEYEQFVASVRDVLVPIFDDIERYGLKTRHLRKHRRRVEDLYRYTINTLPDRQDVLSKYKKRFERYRHSLFWTTIKSLGITMPLRGHCVIWRFSERFPAHLLRWALSDICAFLPFHKRAASKISHFWDFCSLGLKMWFYTSRNDGSVPRAMHLLRFIV
jgi:hypothetical protein